MTKNIRGDTKWLGREAFGLSYTVKHIFLHLICTVSCLASILQKSYGCNICWVITCRDNSACSFTPTYAADIAIIADIADQSMTFVRLIQEIRFESKIISKAWAFIPYQLKWK